MNGALDAGSNTVYTAMYRAYESCLHTHERIKYLYIKDTTVPVNSIKYFLAA